MKSINMDMVNQLIVKNTSDHVALLDIHGRVQYGAATKTSFFGYPQEEFYGKSAFDYLHADDISAVKQVFAEVLATGSTRKCKFRYLHRDGHWLFVEAQAIPVVTEQAEIEAVIILTKDLTQARETEQALQTSEAKYRNVINNIQEVVFQTDEQGIWTFLNPAWTRITGFPLDQSIGRNFLDYIHPHDHQRSIDSFISLLHGKETNCRYEIRYLTNSGRICWFEVTSGLLYAEDGSVNGTQGSMRDITESKFAQQELAKNEQKYKSLFDYHPDAVFSLSLNGNFLSANEASEKIFGYSVDELLQLSFLTLTVKEDGETILARLGNASNGQPQDFETAVLHKDGQRIEVRLAAVPIIINDEVVGIYGIAKDITQRKRVAEALVAAKEEAERANEAKSRFLSSMSHELRTPMNAILGFAQILKYDPLEPLTVFQQESVDHIMHAGQHLLELINDVLDLSRIEAGSMLISLEGVDIEQVVDETVSLLIPLAEQRGIRIENQIANCEDLFVYADYTRLKQALVNLVSNAVKYNKANGNVTVSYETTERGQVRIRVEDTGIGIQADKLEAVFEPFNRLGVERKNIEGTGIGLTITKRIMEMMGGSVGVTSKVGEGSCFFLELPIASTQFFSEPMTHKDGILAADEQGHTYTILYIEDNPSNLALVEQILSRHKDIHLLTAPQASLGIELARAHGPDLILMDIHLPDLDGFQALEILQDDKITRNIPVIALSANAMPRDVEEGLKAGFVRYLTKPLMIPQFMEAVYSVVGASEK